MRKSINVKMKLLAFLLGSAICENCIDKENDPKGLEVWFEKRRYGTRDVL